MSWRANILLGLLAVVRGDYIPPVDAGYTTPAVNSPPPSLLTPTASYSPPTVVPYTAAVVRAQPSSPTTMSVTTMSTPSADNPYTSAGQNDVHNHPGYSYPLSSYSARDTLSPLYQQPPPNFISQYYKQPPYSFPNSQQPFSPPQTLNPQSFYPHSCTSPNNPHFHPNQPYFQSTLFRVPNPLAFLNGFVPPNSFQATVHPPSPRGPLPSPGYYSPNHPPSQPLFSVGYTSPVNQPYNNVH